MTRESVVRMIESEIRQYGSARQFAAQNDVNVAHISEVLRGVRDPQPALLKALELERVVTYRKCKPESEAK